MIFWVLFDTFVMIVNRVYVTWVKSNGPKRCGDRHTYREYMISNEFYNIVEFKSKLANRECTLNDLQLFIIITMTCWLELGLSLVRQQNELNELHSSKYIYFVYIIWLPRTNKNIIIDIINNMCDRLLQNFYIDVMILLWHL